MKRALVLVATAAMVFGGSTAVVAQKASKRQKIVVVVNGRAKPLQRLYANTVGRNSWEEDILGDALLPPGAGQKINFDDGSDYCQVDIKAVWSDGVTVFRKNVDICAIKRLVLSS